MNLSNMLTSPSAITGADRTRPPALGSAPAPVRFGRAGAIYDLIVTVAFATPWTAMMLLDRRWFLSIAALCALSWLAAVALLPTDPEWLHFGFAVRSSEVMAVLIHIVRVRDLRRIESLRMADEEASKKM